MPKLVPLLPPLAAALLALSGAGCAHSSNDDAFAESVSAGEKPVAMSGQGTYYDGQILATLTISRGVGHGRDPGSRGGWSRDTEGMDNEQQIAYFKARGALGSPLTPVTMRLKLQNKGSQIVQVEIQEVNSDLGNFAVEPSLLSLAPGQTAEPNPMISQLGITSDTIPVKVTLSMKSQVQSQSIAVMTVKGPPPPPPAPPAAPPAPPPPPS